MPASPADRIADTNWWTAPLPTLLRFIADTYHAPLRHELPRLRVAAGRVPTGDRTADTAFIASVAGKFQALADALAVHVEYQDRVAFPAILRWVAARDAPPAPDVHTRLERDPVGLGRRVRQLAEATDWFQPPVGAGQSVCDFFTGLADLAEATHMHLHLEHHVLWPRLFTARLDVPRAGAPPRARAHATRRRP